MPATDEQIVQIARHAAIRGYRWKNRGRAPGGYIDGMAVAFAHACRDLAAGDPAVAVIAARAAGDPQHDVLDWYGAELSGAGLTLAAAADRLLAVYAILLGLGMRESSGKHCEGRDLSAANVTADTAEAGLFQVSHNATARHPQLQSLIERFRGRDDLLAIFDDGVHCSASSWRDWGEGAGKEFQALTKQCPAFAVLYAAVLLRCDRRHWGPINRKEAEVVPEGIALLQAVRRAVAAA